MVWTKPGNTEPEIQPLPKIASPEEAAVEESTETVDCPVCRGSSLWRDPLLLLALAGMVTLWYQGVESRLEAKQTDLELDIAIRGHGYFQILLPNGTFAYTRFGRFSLNEHGQMVTAEGYQIQPPISLPEDFQRVTVGTDGAVSVVRSSAPNATTVVGNLSIALFANPDGLAQLEPGRPYFEATSLAGLQSAYTPGTHGVGELSQGWLESHPWFSNSSLLTLGMGLTFVLLARMLGEMRRQLESLVKQSAVVPVSVPQESRQAA